MLEKILMDEMINNKIMSLNMILLNFQLIIFIRDIWLLKKQLAIQ